MWWFHTLLTSNPYHIPYHLPLCPITYPIIYPYTLSTTPIIYPYTLSSTPIPYHLPLSSTPIPYHLSPHPIIYPYLRLDLRLYIPPITPPFFRNSEMGHTLAFPSLFSPFTHLSYHLHFSPTPPHFPHSTLSHIHSHSLSFLRKEPKDLIK